MVDVCSDESDRVDRIIRDFERIILDYAKDCKKFGKKVRILE